MCDKTEPAPAAGAGIVARPWCYICMMPPAIVNGRIIARPERTFAEVPTDHGAMNAFREDVEAMIPALRRYARALARDADVADDLVQDTLVRALRSERLFLGGDIRSWLYTILT